MLAEHSAEHTPSLATFMQCSVESKRPARHQQHHEHEYHHCQCH